MPSVDLHAHTTISDGKLSPRGLVRAAADAGVDVLAVTDHDTSEGVADAIDEARTRGLRIIPGMEISADHDGRGVHVLAYFHPAALPKLEAWQATRRKARRARVEAMLDRLSALGIDLDRAAIRPSDPKASPGRPLIARALVAGGHVSSMNEAFDRYLGRGKPAHVPTRGPTVAEAIALVHSLPGLAVVAHPGVDELESYFEAFKGYGLDGVEVYHASHSPERVEALRARTRELDLLVTGGSDYHGDPATDDPDMPGGKRLGNVPLPAETWERFDAAYTALAAPPPKETT